MFGISFKTWQDICEMYFEIEDGSKKAYLQWFPFAKLTETDEELLKSEAFFYKYIKAPGFILFPEAMRTLQNYIQKGDGSFRDSSLLSPILYLILQAIGKEISERYHMIRNINIDAFYAGNICEMRPKYKQDYDNFYKTVNLYTSECNYFIKTDITNFYSNINVDILMQCIDSNCNSDEQYFSQTQLKIYKELILYCGNGRFPLVENSVATSFLATIVYLDEIDQCLFEFISKKVNKIKSFKIVRYVDDMYILFSADIDKNEVHKVYSQIRNEYSSILKKYSLALNGKKCCVKKIEEINDELKKSLYDEIVKGVKHEIEELFDNNTLYYFVIELLDKIKTEFVDIEVYNDLIDKHFGRTGIEFTPTEVYNHFIYENDAALHDFDTITAICDLINEDVSIISLDPKRFTVMIMKTQSSTTIKALLNQLFQRNRKKLWNSYDTAIAISYLIQSEFKHIDLLEVLDENCPELKKYYDYCCQQPFLRTVVNEKLNIYREIIGDDWKAYFLYFMYWTEKRKNNTLAEYAYFKNFFDRITADMAFRYKYDLQCKAPNYKLFYKEKEHIKLYACVANSKVILEKAHKLRNENPLSHASAGLIESTSSTQQLKECIKDLWQLIDQYRLIQTEKELEITLECNQKDKK